MLRPKLNMELRNSGGNRVDVPSNVNIIPKEVTHIGLAHGFKD